MSQQPSVYDQLGEEKIYRLVVGFYQEVESIPELRNLYPKELEPARKRLYWFLLHVFGGPSTYLEKRGHPMLRRRHFQWPIDAKMRDLWLSCMFKALDQISMTDETRDFMSTYFSRAAHHMVNRNQEENL